MLLEVGQRHGDGGVVTCFTGGGAMEGARGTNREKPHPDGSRRRGEQSGGSTGANRARGEPMEATPGRLLKNWGRIGGGKRSAVEGKRVEVEGNAGRMKTVDGDRRTGWTPPTAAAW